eukprot:scaffold14974_cov195-Amphora_coffeaeformis.AAC.56
MVELTRRVAGSCSLVRCEKFAKYRCWNVFGVQPNLGMVLGGSVALFVSYPGSALSCMGHPII